METLSDFAGRLRILAIAAAIPLATMNQQILSVIRSTTDDHETRMKCLDGTTTLDTLLAWCKQHDIKEACASLIEFNRSPSFSNKGESINQIGYGKSTPKQRRCYTCGEDYPHSGGIQCPARNQNCTNCNKPGHYARVCNNTTKHNFLTQQKHNYRGNKSPYYYQQTLGRRQQDSPLRQSVYRNHQNQQSPTRHENQLANDKYGGPSSFSHPKTIQTIRTIADLSENELVTEFEAFYRHRQLNFSQEDTTTDQQIIRQIITRSHKIEIVNELTAAQLAACPRSFITLGTSKIEHLIDTGTNLNILSRSTFNSLKNKPSLRETDVRAYGFHSKTAVPLLGEFYAPIKFKNITILARYIVLNGEADDIIGYNTASKLGIVSLNCDNNPNHVEDEIEHLNSIQSINIVDSSTWIHPLISHPEIFTEELGMLKNFYVNLQVDPSARPIQQPAYQIPFGLHSMTKDKLDFWKLMGLWQKTKSLHGYSLSNQSQKWTKTTK